MVRPPRADGGLAAGPGRCSSRSADVCGWNAATGQLRFELTVFGPAYEHKMDVCVDAVCETLD